MSFIQRTLVDVDPSVLIIFVRIRARSVLHNGICMVNVTLDLTKKVLVTARS